MVTLSIEHVGVKLGKRAIVRDVSAAFGPGELVGIVGPNGAGKSTLVRALVNLVDYSGRITLDGQDLHQFSRADIAARIAYLPQGQTLHWPLSVERLVGLGRLPHLGPMSRISAEDEAAIERAMQRADVAILRERDATQLSGGERARVLLARALAVEAPALLADEPLASLDPGHQIDVMDLLQGEVAAGRLVITVLHDLTMAARYCTWLIIVNDGLIVADGPPAQVLTPALLREVYGIEARVELDGDWPSITALGRSRS